MKIYESSIPLSHYTIFLTNVKGNFSIKFVENLHKTSFVGYLYKKYSSNITIFTKENLQIVNYRQFEEKKIGNFCDEKTQKIPHIGRDRGDFGLFIEQIIHISR